MDDWHRFSKDYMYILHHRMLKFLPLGMFDGESEMWACKATQTVIIILNIEDIDHKFRSKILKFNTLEYERVWIRVSDQIIFYINYADRYSEKLKETITNIDNYCYNFKQTAENTDNRTAGLVIFTKDRYSINENDGRAAIYGSHNLYVCLLDYEGGIRWLKSSEYYHRESNYTKEFIINKIKQK